MNKQQADLLARLNRVLDGCRDDMHEPDEQGVSCRIVGDHLDNAMPASLTHHCGEFLVCISSQSTHLGEDYFNLAGLIALARMAGRSRTRALEDAAKFVERHEVGHNPTVGQILTEVDEPSATYRHAGQCYAKGLRGMK